MKKNKLVSRRDFLTKSAAAIGVVTAFPYIVPARVFGAAAPSNRIGMGMIGMGGQMGGHFRNMLSRSNVQVLAVCDVHDGRLQSAYNSAVQTYGRNTASGTFQGVQAYREYEKIIDRSDIDAVFICTPDHWHVPIGYAAVKSGKDVYSEKPLTLTIKEGRLLSDACKQYGRIFQVGSQQRSERAFRRACEIVRSGWIGKITSCYASLGQFSPPMTLPEQPIPPGFDYDRWLGPTPWFPYNDQRVEGNFGGGWRRFWEYGARKNGDWGAHHFDIIQWALGMDDSGPVKFVPKGYKGTQYQTHYYADGVEVYRDRSIINGQMIQFNGEDGIVLCSRNGRLETQPAELAQQPLGPNDVHLYESNDHIGNFIDCLLNRKQTICTAEIGHRTATVCHLNAIAERLGRPIEWNPDKEQIINDSQAERWLDRPRRAPYFLY